MVLRHMVILWNIFRGKLYCIKQTIWYINKIKSNKLDTANCDNEIWFTKLTAKFI